MRVATRLKTWRLLPGYAINGIAVAIGIGFIQLLATLVVGAGAAQLVVSGATCASLADIPNNTSRTWQRVTVAVGLSFAAALIVDLARPHPVLLGFGVAAIAFCAMMTMTWGARAGAVAFSPILSMIFSMAVPASSHVLGVAGWNACGGIAYLVWAIVASIACQRRYRTLALVEAMRGAARLFGSRALVLDSYRHHARDAAPLRAWVRGEATLADRLQSARDLVFAATTSLHWQRDTAILLRLIDLRDLLLASPLDVELLGDDPVSQSLVGHVADTLREIGARMDAAADALRDGVLPTAAVMRHPDFASRMAAVDMAADDARRRLLPALVSRQLRMTDDVARVHRLLHGETESLPLTASQLQRFVSTEGWPLQALRAHWQSDSLVLRHAIRTSLALCAAYFIALALPWGSHPYWLVLSVAVVLRGTLGDTLARRNARVLGTMLGCLLVVALSHLPSLDAARGIFLAALATAHAFATQRYWLTATAASIMALMQSHLVNPGAGFAIAERVADTLLGAMLAWIFSYVLPSWERNGARNGIERVFANLRTYAAYALKARADDAVEERLARRKAYDALASLGNALQRSSVEPERVRLPVRQIATLLDHGERMMAHLSMVRLLLASMDGDVKSAPIATALAAAHAQLSKSLDLGVVLRPSGDNPAPSGVEHLPMHPPAHDRAPWLARRLALTLHDATRMRRALDQPNATGFPLSRK